MVLYNRNFVPTQEEIRYHLDYDPTTGIFTWKNPTNTKIRKGSEAGYKDPCGYIYIFFKNKRFSAARLAFFYMTGRWHQVR